MKASPPSSLFIFSAVDVDENSGAQLRWELWWLGSFQRPMNQAHMNTVNSVPCSGILEYLGAIFLSKGVPFLAAQVSTKSVNADGAEDVSDGLVADAAGIVGMLCVFFPICLLLSLAYGNG